MGTAQSFAESHREQRRVTGEDFRTLLSMLVTYFVPSGSIRSGSDLEAARSTGQRRPALEIVFVEFVVSVASDDLSRVGLTSFEARGLFTLCPPCSENYRDQRRFGRELLEQNGIGEMNQTEIASSTVEELTDAYRRAASAHGEATRDGDHETANRHRDIVAAIYHELRERGLPAQSALGPLMQDSDEAVRSWAASHGLEFAPEEAESVLANLAAGRGISAFNAKMTLREWRKGTLSFP